MVLYKIFFSSTHIPGLIKMKSILEFGKCQDLKWSVLDFAVGEGNGTPLQYSCLENPMDGGAWKAAVHGVAEGQTLLSDFTFTFHFHALEKETTPVFLPGESQGQGSLVGCHRWGRTELGTTEAT